MTPSLLNLLPDIVRAAALRSAEALRMLGPTPATNGTWQPTTPFSSVQQPPPGPARPPTRRMWVQRDVPAMLTLLAGQGNEPSHRHKIGFLWLSSLHRTPSDDAISGWPEHPRSPAHTLLHDLTLRLFVARELFSPGAIIAITVHPGLEDCTRLLVQAVLGLPAIWTRCNERTAAPGVLVCTSRHEGMSAAKSRGRRVALPLTQQLRRLATPELTALMLTPGRCAAGLLQDWPGHWIVTHANPDALAQLQQQLALQKPPRPTAATAAKVQALQTP